MPTWGRRFVFLAGGGEERGEQCEEEGGDEVSHAGWELKRGESDVPKLGFYAENRRRVGVKTVILTRKTPRIRCVWGEIGCGAGELSGRRAEEWTLRPPNKCLRREG